MVISHVDTAGRWKTVVCKRYIEKIFFEFFQSGRKGAGKTGAHLIIYKGFKDSRFGDLKIREACFDSCLVES